MAYKSYHGAGYYARRRRIIIILLLLFLLLAAVFLFFYTQEFIIFTADGFRFSFTPQEDTSDQPDPGAPPNIVIEDPVDPPNPDNTDSVDPQKPDEDPEQTSPGDSFTLRALRVADGGFDASALAAPYNSLAVTVKDTDGVLLVDEEMSAAADGIRQAGGRSVAIVSALRDNAGPRGDISVAVTTGSGARWLDYRYISWYNPYAAGTADALVALAESCYEAGFDELVLDNFHFPVEGKTELISYGEQELTRTEALTELLRTLRERAPEELAISVVLTDTAFSSLADEEAGQDVAAMAPYCVRLYARTDDADISLSTLDSALENTGCSAALLLTAAQPPEGERAYILQNE